MVGVLKSPKGLRKIFFFISLTIFYLIPNHMMKIEVRYGEFVVLHC